MLEKQKRILAAFLAMVLLLAFFTSCKTQAPAEPEPAPSFIFYNLLPLPVEPEHPPKPLDFGHKEKLEAKNKQNEHSAAWLEMSDTDIDGVVMFSPDEDRFFYLRRGFNKEELFEGSYFIDSRSRFDGTREGFSKNMVIYGHSMTDDPNAEWFSQFKKLHDPKWAKEHPYLYFSTDDEDMAWEIFAVFNTHVSFIYNTPNPTDEKYRAILQGARDRSIYNYNVDVSTDDTIVTMSTCIYQYNGTYLTYPNAYRFVVMARLVPRGETLKNEARFTTNDNIKIDTP